MPDRATLVCGSSLIQRLKQPHVKDNDSVPLVLLEITILIVVIWRRAGMLFRLFSDAAYRRANDRQRLAHAFPIDLDNFETGCNDRLFGFPIEVAISHQSFP